MVLLRRDAEEAPRRLVEGLIYLRAPEPRDYAAWSELRQSSRAHLQPWEPVWSADAHARATYRYKLRRYAEEAREGRGFAFLIFRAEDDALVGGITLSNVRRGPSQSATVGYWMGVRHVGRGYAKRAVRATLRFAFGPLGLHRIEAACQPENERSRRVLLGAGFREEGMARQYLNINGDWRDHLLFGLVRGDLSPDDK